ncbi:MAG: hypothetical protein HZB38_07990 [Planctomycetes bacterium]|nr:hypothetical protein [Planctomycetota bacterium]
MLVVIAIIGLVLGLGLPAFNSMTAQSRLSKARQLLQGALNRASVLSVADRDMVAVRIFPGAWDSIDAASTANTSGAGNAGTQVIALYRYVTRSEQPYATQGTSDALTVTFTDRFERIKESPAIVLPPDVWMAPTEALLDDRIAPGVDRDADGEPGTADDAALNELSGNIGLFQLDIDPRTNADQRTSATRAMPADDFLIVFDSRDGLVGSRARPAWTMFAFDPRPAAGPGSSATGGLETSGEYRVANNRGAYVPGRTFRRFNYTGAVLYSREKLAQLGPNADPVARRDLLSRTGLPLYITSQSGSLTTGGR